MLYVSHKQSNVCPWVFKENINKTFFNKTFLSVKTVDGNYSDIDNLINLLKTHILLKNHLLFWSYRKKSGKRSFAFLLASQQSSLVFRKKSRHNKELEHLNVSSV